MRKLWMCARKRPSTPTTAGAETGGQGFRSLPAQPLEGLWWQLVSTTIKASTCMNLLVAHLKQPDHIYNNDAYNCLPVLNARLPRMVQPNTTHFSSIGCVAMALSTASSPPFVPMAPRLSTVYQEEREKKKKIYVCVCERNQIEKQSEC